MLRTKEIPDRKDLVDFNYAVAGHAGTLCDPDGELFIKPCTQKEIAFYESAAEAHPDFAEIMPLFMGTLLLNDATDLTSINEQIPVVADHISQEMKEEVVKLAHTLQPKPEVKDNIKWIPNETRRITTDQAIVLENAAYGYKHPNIMDAKLGSRLWANDAPLEKKQRFDKIASETTSGSLGFRIAGMRVYRGSDDPSQLDSEEYRKFDKEYGRKEVNDGNIVDAMRGFIFNKHAGIDEDLGRAIAGAFLEDLKRVEQVLAAEESRMYSASLLFIFEGDGEALRAAIEDTSASATMSQRDKVEADKADDGPLGPSTTLRVDSGIDVDEHGELILPPGAEVMDMSDDDEELNLPRIYSLKLIDFAHAEWVPGQGPDENNLRGVRSLIRIFTELAE
ncbi:SAICAR synthase-like protein [Thozetella sp. PMI_491]|nr:SAICAR synthase-like protein [Thozetella sp. PMI_491]